jgi:MFS family permease
MSSPAPPPSGPLDPVPARLEPSAAATAAAANGSSTGADPGLASEAAEAIARPRAAGPPRRRGRLSVRTFTSLDDSNYRWYFLSLLGHFASMNTQMFIRGYLVFEMTGSFAALGFVSLANAVPNVGLSMIGGVFTDRVRHKKHIVQVCQLVNAAVTFAIAALLFAGELRVEHLILSAFVQGITNSFMNPARQSLTNEVVGRDRLMNALALNNAGMNVTRLMVPTFAGWTLAALGPGYGIEGAEWIFTAMGTLYLLSVATLFRVLEPPSEVRSTPVGHVFRQLADGIRYIWRTPTVRMLLLINVLFVMCAMPYFQLLPGFVRQVLDGGPTQLGLLMSIQGVGSLVGSLVIASLPNRNRGRLLIGSAIVLGAGLLMFSLSTWYWVTAGILLIVGVGQAGRMSISQVLVQTYTDDAYRGRVLSVYTMEMGIVQMGTFLVALLAAAMGPQFAIGLTSVALLLLGVYTLFFLPRLRDLE